MAQNTISTLGKLYIEDTLESYLAASIYQRKGVYINEILPPTVGRMADLLWTLPYQDISF